MAGFGTTLYYPYIDIRDREWLRSAIFFSDGLQTIVPSSIERPYRVPDTEVLYEEGFLSPLHCDLHGDLLNDLGRRVLGLIQDPENLRELGFRLPSGPLAMALIHADKLGHGLRDGFEAAQLHAQKMSSEMRALFANADASESNFLLVNADFAAIYMAALAARLSQETGAFAISNEPSAFGANLRSILDEVASARENAARAVMISVVFEALTLDPTIPIQELLKFRRKREHQLNALANKLEELSSHLEDAESLSEMRQNARRIYERRVYPELEKLKQSLRDAGIGAAWGALRMGTTLSATAGGALHEFLSVPANFALGAAAFVTVADVGVQSYLAGRKIRRDSPYTFLLDVQDRLSLPHNLLED